MTYDTPYDLLVGTYGWDNQSWAKKFYAEDTPVEWYFLAYSNDYRSVMAPASIWPTISQNDVERWVEESDPGFIFTLELPSNLLPASRDEQRDKFATFIELVAPIKEQTTGFFLDFCDQKIEPAALESFIEMLVQQQPVCIDLPEPLNSDEEILELLQRYCVGVCWHCDKQKLPEQSGDFLVALSEERDPKRLRMHIENLGPLLAQGKRVAFYFNGPHAPDSAWQARIIAELMGI